MKRKFAEKERNFILNLVEKIKLPINFSHYSLALKHIFMLPQDLMQNDENGNERRCDGSMKNLGHIFRSIFIPTGYVFRILKCCRWRKNITELLFESNDAFSCWIAFVLYLFLSIITILFF